MFTPHLNKAVGFSSSWKTEQQLTFSSTQTEDISTKDDESQVLQTAECSVQTDDIAVPTPSSAPVNEASLLEFLQRIEPHVHEELNKQERSAAFEGYSPVDDDSNTGAQLMHTLRWPQLFKEGVVTGLSWSSTGAVVAVAYGADTHDTWCQHRAAVALWNINRCDSVSITPERVLEVSSCVPTLAFHPSNPAILALATRTGEVHVYDLSESERVTPIATGSTGGSGVTCLMWCQGASVVAAATEGGHVLFWTVSLTKETMTLDTGFVVLAEDLPRGYRAVVAGGGEREGSGGGIGISCLSFNSEDPTVFVLGVKGGSLLLCSTQGKKQGMVTIEGVPLLRCVVSMFSGHSGRVLGVHCSPRHRNALVSLGSDDQLKLHSLLQPHHPVATLYSDEPLTTVQWAPVRSLLLATSTITGQINFLDACGLQPSGGGVGGQGDKGRPLLSLPPPEKTAPVSALSFNVADVCVVGVGDCLGRVWVWRLPTDVVSPKIADIARLSALLATAVQD